MERGAKVGPEGFDKIAILGSAPSSTMLAPFDDPSWAIWACSPGTFAQIAVKRSEAWFELHRWLPSEPGKSGAPGTRPWFSPEFNTFLQQYRGTVFMTDPRSMRDPAPWGELLKRDGPPQPSIPNSAPFPYEYLIRKHGPYHFTSSIAWMLALALEYKPRVLGLFGIDMAASSEYAYQRPGCQHFVGLAAAAGARIALPPESDLMRPTTMYGIGEHNERHVKLRERMMEFEAAKASSHQLVQTHTQNFKFMEGACEATKYFLEVWSDDIRPGFDQAMSFAGAYVNDIKAKQTELGSTGAEVVSLEAKAS